ncbi:hypothetical protein WJX79_006295 [Trebouxia sp. C0005]
MYSDRLAGKRALRPALDTSSRLFQHITDNQEDRRLYEEASVQLYDATPNANVAKRHGVLKAKINGKMPQPWMSMTRQVNVSSAAGQAPPRGSLRADQRPHAQLSRRQEAQRPLDGLDLFNMRHKAPDVRAEASTHGAATEYQQPAQQAQMVVDQPILDGLDRGSYQGFGTAGGQRALVPQHKRMRAFDSDIGVECEQSLNVVRRNGPISAGGGRVCPEHVAQIGTVFKRLG